MKAASGPVTSVQLADALGLSERWVREWLLQQVNGWGTGLRFRLEGYVACMLVRGYGDIGFVFRVQGAIACPACPFVLTIW